MEQYHQIPAYPFVNVYKYLQTDNSSLTVIIRTCLIISMLARCSVGHITEIDVCFTCELRLY